MVATEADVAATAVETEVVVTVAEATVAEAVTAEADTAEEADVMADAVDVMADVVATAEAEAEVKNPATVAKAETDVQVVIQATDDEVQVDLNKKKRAFSKGCSLFLGRIPNCPYTIYRYLFYSLLVSPLKEN